MHFRVILLGSQVADQALILDLASQYLLNKGYRERHRVSSDPSRAEIKFIPSLESSINLPPDLHRTQSRQTVTGNECQADEHCHYVHHDFDLDTFRITFIRTPDLCSLRNSDTHKHPLREIASYINKLQSVHAICYCIPADSGNDGNLYAGTSPLFILRQLVPEDYFQNILLCFPQSSKLSELCRFKEAASVMIPISRHFSFDYDCIATCRKSSLNHQNSQNARHADKHGDSSMMLNLSSCESLLNSVYQMNACEGSQFVNLSANYQALGLISREMRQIAVSLKSKRAIECEIIEAHKKCAQKLEKCPRKALAKSRNDDRETKESEYHHSHYNSQTRYDSSYCDVTDMNMMNGTMFPSIFSLFFLCRGSKKENNKSNTDSKKKGKSSKDSCSRQATCSRRTELANELASMDKELMKNQTCIEELNSNQKTNCKKIMYILKQIYGNASHSKCTRDHCIDYIDSILAECQNDKRLSQENQKAVIECFEQLKSDYFLEKENYDKLCLEISEPSLHKSVDDLIARCRNDLQKDSSKSTLMSPRHRSSADF